MKRYNDDDIVLLLTATVTPQFSYMAHKAEERLRQYIVAIDWYLHHTPYKIVIGENSGCYDLLDNFDKKFADRMELVCYQERNTSRQFGYNEMLILKNVYDKSQFLKAASLIFKITGRLIVQNITWHVRQLRHYTGGGNFIAAHIHRSLVYIDSRFFAFTTSRFEDILAEEPNCCAISWDDIHAGKCKNGDNGKWVDFESTIGAVIHRGMMKDRRSFRFLLFPIFVKGIEGYRGTAYNHSFLYKIKLSLKKIVWVIDWHLIVCPFWKLKHI